jgi:steroid delta-isomerase-like uncharacterized protein
MNNLMTGFFDMTKYDLDTLIRDWASGWSSASELPAFLSLFTDDAVYEDVAAAHIQHGKGEIENFYLSARNAFPDFNVRLTSHMAVEGRAAAEWHMTGTHQGELLGIPATHKPISVRGASVFELSGNKIKRVADYYNMAEMVSQLGA